MAIQWVVSSGSTRDLAFANAWFLFELMAKSMGEHLARTDKLHQHRKVRFSTQFMEDITTLLGHITRDIIERYNKVTFVLYVKYLLAITGWGGKLHVVVSGVGNKSTLRTTCPS